MWREFLGDQTGTRYCRPAHACRYSRCAVRTSSDLFHFKPDVQWRYIVGYGLVFGIGLWGWCRYSDCSVPSRFSMRACRSIKSWRLCSSSRVLASVGTDSARSVRCSSVLSDARRENSSRSNSLWIKRFVHTTARFFIRGFHLWFGRHHSAQ